MDALKLPCPLQLTGNVRRNWELFKQRLDLFLTATSTDHPKTEAVKAAILLSAAGDEALEVYNNFTFAEGELKDDYETLVRKFDAYFIEQGNEVYERHLFRMRVQDEGERFERFVRDLRTQAKLCNFGTLEESLIRDQIVFGTNDKTVREKMLRDKTLTLQKAENICKAAEAAAQQNAAWVNERVQVDSTRRYERGKEQKGRCKHCGRAHAPRQCPAYGKTCYACKKQNHFSSCCKNPQVHGIQEDREDSFDVLDVSICGVSTKPGKDWTVRGKVSGHDIELKVDTGSQANLIPLSIFQRISKVNTLRKSAAVLTAYNGSEIKHLGVATKALEMNGTTRDTAFFIVKKGRQAIIGLSTCIEFGIVPANIDSVRRSGRAGPETEFAHLFHGTGCVQRTYKMVLRPDAVPVVQPARKVPLALKQPLRDELARMEKASIIVKVEEPTEWFVPGKDLLLADMLSRAPSLSPNPEAMEDIEVHAVRLVSCMGRRLRTNVPEYSTELGCPIVKHQQRATDKALHPLQQGDTVRILDDDWSRKARVLQEAAPRSHIVETEDGRLLRRNRQHLLQTREKYRRVDEDDNSNAENSSLQNERQEPPEQGPSAPGLTGHPQANIQVFPKVETSEAEPRRSTRQRNKPQRLQYEANFRQVS
ncbi:uncharacterized protein [Dermacentor albipictus]|uniref:uncharacterized protein isoform X2 n=1 Tax=Dermacentor albipictus TaxID=60249 RepID=UPI0038FC4AB8